jgi:DNA-directed RNA polymerase specialized sigma24 family protein
MNAPRRKELNAIYELIAQARDRLQIVKDDEEEYLLNIPDNPQTSERYERAEEVVESLEDALSTLDDVLEAVEEATE